MSLGETLGRREAAMNWSQENCPIDSHRWTCERWGGDFVHSLDIAWQDLAIIELNVFSKALFPAGRRALWRCFKCRKVFPCGIHHGEKVAHTFHSVLFSCRFGGCPGVITGAIFLDFRGKTWYNVSRVIICPLSGIYQNMECEYRAGY